MVTLSLLAGAWLRAPLGGVRRVTDSERIGEALSRDQRASARLGASLIGHELATLGESPFNSITPGGERGNSPGRAMNNL